LTGLVYLVIIVCGLYAGLAVRDVLIDPGNPAASLANILQQETLYRSAYLADLLMVVADVVIAFLFYGLLQGTSPFLAAVAAGFRLLQAAILGANLSHALAPVLLLQQMGADGIPGPALLEFAAYHFRAFDHGYLTSGVFFAINCMLMGWLLYRSVHFPRFWGWVLGIAGVAYMADALAAFIAPSAKPFTEPAMLLSALFAEVGFCIWLLAKGIRREGEAIRNQR
jgi:hypothetical protein